MSAINFNWFYHNNCKEFQGIKNRIWECNNPTEKQLAEWKAEHSAGYKAINSYLKMFEARLRQPTRPLGVRTRPLGASV